MIVLLFAAVIAGSALVAVSMERRDTVRLPVPTGAPVATVTPEPMVPTAPPPAPPGEPDVTTPPAVSGQPEPAADLTNTDCDERCYEEHR